MKKFYATYLLFLFIAFLATPTVIKMLDKNADVSIVFSFTEEEKSETSSTASVDFVLNTHDLIDHSKSEKKDNSIIDDYRFVVITHYTTIASPPPDVVI
jgi:hypothetical protein